MTPLGIFSGGYLPVAIQVVVDDAPRKHIRYVVFVREQVDDYDLLILVLLVCLEAAGEAYSIQVLVGEGPIIETQVLVCCASCARNESQLPRVLTSVPRRSSLQVTSAGARKKKA